jgi:HAE1 family hydrophobic/amphiphilic exporter-1
MSVTRTVVKRPTTLLIIFILLIGLGLYAALDLAIDLFPEINPPVLFVFSSYSGAGPEEVETTLTRPLEGALSNVSNIETITSTSTEGGSQIMLEFTWGTNMAEASNDVRDKLEFIKPYLPEDAESPQIFKFDPSMIPILDLMVAGNRSPEELREIAEDFVQPRLEQVEGVAMVSVMGGREKAIRVEVPQNRLEAYNLTLTQISGMIRGQNVQVSAGSITEGNKNYLILTAGEFQDLDQIRNTVVTYRGGTGNPGASEAPTRVVRLRDIANVYEGYKKEESTVLVNGKPGVFIIIQKQSGTNSVKTADNVLKRLDKINREIPLGVRVEVIYDMTNIIRNSLRQVSSTAVTGAFLAVVILIFFLRSLKSTVIIGLSIPISFIVTLMLMYFFGLTLNIMTLAGLALGIGMLVDNSIVILENIYRYREKGAKLTASAILGSQEMINAIVASTLTTICVFAPLALFRAQLGMMGELFSGLAFTVVISLSSSLLVAIFLVPVLTSKYLPLRSRRQRPLTGVWKVLDESLERLFRGLENLYRRILRVILRRKKITVFVIFLIFVGSLFLIPKAGFKLMPEQEEDFVQIGVELPIGTKLEVTKTMMRQLELLIEQELHGYKDIITSSGERSFMGFLGASQSHKGELTVTLPPYGERTENSTAIKQRLRKHFGDFPSAIFSFAHGGGISGGASPIDILVKSNDLERGKEVAERILGILEKDFPEVTEPDMDRKEGLPQIEIFIDRDKAYSLGLNVHDIGQEVRANIDGVTSSKYRVGGSEYDILVILDERDRDALPDLQKIFCLNNQGMRIPLSSFAHLERTIGPVDIKRENQTRIIHIEGGLAPGVKLNEVELAIHDKIADEIPSDESTIITFSGEWADFMKYGNKFIMIIIVSLCLVFGVMASQFESFLDPFIIFFTIPLTLIGVILLYVATGETFSLFTAVGLVMLGGIAVNNGIVLVDYTNLMRKRGMSIIDACVEAGGNRLRPILMTTLTTVLGLIPMSFFPGEGAELVQPIGKTVVGGLTVSALLTLFLIPVIYAIFNAFSEKRRKRREERKLRRIERQRELSGEQA